MDEIPFRVLGRCLVIESDDEEALRYLRGAYRRLVAPIDSALPLHRAQILIASGPPTVRFDGEEFAIESTATPFLVAYYGASRIFRECFARDRRYTPWYAAGISIDGAAMLISAPSGTGKTTLALELLRRGHRLYGDEFVLVRKDDRHVLPFPRALMIRDGAEIYHDVDAEELFERPIVAEPAPLAAAFLLERGPRTELSPLSPAVFALSVAARVGQDGEGLGRLSSFLALLGPAPCYRLTMDDLESTADAVEGIAARCSSIRAA